MENDISKKYSDSITEAESIEAKLEIIKTLTTRVQEAKVIISEKDKEIEKLKEALKKLGRIMNIAVIQWNPIRDNTEDINKILEDTIGKKISDCG